MQVKTEILAPSVRKTDYRVRGEVQSNDFKGTTLTLPIPEDMSDDEARWYISVHLYAQCHKDRFSGVAVDEV